MPQNGFDLSTAAVQEMIRQGFHPDFPSGAKEQLQEIRTHADPSPAAANARDMRQLLWSSIDNASSRDLDQIEAAERGPGGIRVMIAIADVDSKVGIGTPLDQHASAETTTVYTVPRCSQCCPRSFRQI